MDRLTKKFTDGSPYCEEIIDVGIEDINYPTYVGRAVDKLAEYEDLEEERKLLKLPCAVGDVVFFSYEKFNFVFPAIISQIIISDLGEGRFRVQYNGCFLDGCGAPEKDFEFDMEDFGKTVFLTFSAAEQVLKKVRKND